MKIGDYSVFGKELFKTLALSEGLFDYGNWKSFIVQYFDSIEAAKINQKIENDLVFFRSQDPASKVYTNDQILSVRRGMLAVLAHRVFGAILEQDASAIFQVEVLAKTIQVSTSVEVHPQAQMTGDFAIDHGHGTVIGATTIMGTKVFCYHGVTLGASGRCLKDGRRHPKVGDDIFLGNGVQILGPSHLGDNVSVGSESMVVDSIVGDNVRISPGVLVLKVHIPANYMIFGFDALTRQFIGRKFGSTKKVETFELEKIDITK